MTTKRMMLLMAVLFQALFSQSAEAGITVRTGETVGRIKPMNAVNNGPQSDNPTNKVGNFRAYKAARFPYARLHDAPIHWGWAHTVDITCVFPDFDADVDDPASYDFTLTDALLKDIHNAGTEVFYRLGQSIEKWSKKYGVLPPADYKKWARICEHVIRHYNEGWADGFHYDIRYWEIWNEPDLGFKDGRWKKNMSPTWNGSDQDFFRFYEVASKHLNKCFPDLEIGGPALCENDDWADNFLKYMSEHKVEIDFFSYHLYASTPQRYMEKNALIRSMLDKYGYTGTDMILDEWNYLSNWTTEWPYTMEVVTSYKGAAFAAAVMSVSQNGPADMLMYYDARPRVSYNGLFNQYTSAPMPQYYSLYAWKNLVRLGSQIEAEVSGEEDVYVIAAKGAYGEVGILVTYFTDDKNVVSDKVIELEVEGCDIRESVSHLTDSWHLYTEVPIDFVEGKATLWLSPNSVTYISLN
ncbi:MAG: hypothetical protein IJ394_00460 [Bacteroidales bacterium]|nr:hypothetical protein [Bacteroidales bacterium]